MPSPDAGPPGRLIEQIAGSVDPRQIVIPAALN